MFWMYHYQVPRIPPNFEATPYSPAMDDFDAYQDLKGMTLTTGTVRLEKHNNAIGISIGGGAPLCPCLYICKVLSNTPASKDGTLQAGDELISINGVSVKGLASLDVSRMIKQIAGDITISYNKLHADPSQGKTLPVILSISRRRLMSSDLVTAYGISPKAAFREPTVTKKLLELDRLEQTYRGIIEHVEKVLKAHEALLETQNVFGDTLAVIGAREPEIGASEAFSAYGEAHRSMFKTGQKIIEEISKHVLNDLKTFCEKVIPDTKTTIKKCLDIKHEYIVYCRKIAEMDEEDEFCKYYGLRSSRAYTGNYEGRLLMRCRELTQNRFVQKWTDAMTKLELLEHTHVHHLAANLQSICKGTYLQHSEFAELVRPCRAVPLKGQTSDENTPETGCSTQKPKIVDDDEVQYLLDAVDDALRVMEEQSELSLSYHDDN